MTRRRRAASDPCRASRRSRPRARGACVTLRPPCEPTATPPNPTRSAPAVRSRRATWSPVATASSGRSGAARSGTRTSPSTPPPATARSPSSSCAPTATAGGRRSSCSGARPRRCGRCVADAGRASSRAVTPRTTAPPGNAIRAQPRQHHHHQRLTPGEQGQAEVVTVGFERGGTTEIQSMGRGMVVDIGVRAPRSRPRAWPRSRRGTPRRARPGAGKTTGRPRRPRRTPDRRARGWAAGA